MLYIAWRRWLFFILKASWILEKVSMRPTAAAANTAPVVRETARALEVPVSTCCLFRLRHSGRPTSPGSCS
eukprot:scaffold118543_cov57-Phaeocystis_antarctica.AAC.2